MKKKAFSALLSIFFLLSLSTLSYSWQGRMAGMGDPFGLVEDKSDFFIHPSKIAIGSGIKYYSHYQFTYVDVPDWDFTSELLSLPTGFFINPRVLRSSNRISGHKADHDALLGTSWPQGKGRAGLFLRYSGTRGDFRGKMNSFSVIFLPDPVLFPGGTSGLNRYHEELDSFSLSLFYGLPVDNLRLGGAIELAHRTEEKKNLSDVTSFFFRSIDTNDPSLVMIPFDSRFWEALFKGTLEGPLGEGKLALTLKGGFIFNGDNDLRSTDIFGGTFRSSHLKGDVKGWKARGDLWLRFPFLKNLDLPFVLAMEYERKSRDGKGLERSQAPFVVNEDFLSYENKETIFHLTAGGGIDKKFNEEDRFAAGIYYKFIRTNQSFSQGFSNNTNFPYYKEHQAFLCLTGEKKLSPGITVRAGVNIFYGWVSEELRFKSPVVQEDRALDGHHWGMATSLGSTIKFLSFSLEPFLGFGYRKLQLSGNRVDSFPQMIQVERFDELKREWVTNAGISITF